MADVEATFSAALRAQFDSPDPDADYTQPTGPVFVCTELPPTSEFDSYARLIRVYGLSGGRRFTLTTPGVSVDCFAKDRITARALALEVDAFIVWQVQRSVRGSVAVGLVQTVSSPALRPYDNTAVRRFGMTYRPTLRDIAA